MHMKIRIGLRQSLNLMGDSNDNNTPLNKPSHRELLMIYLNVRALAENLKVLRTHYPI